MSLAKWQIAYESHASIYLAQGDFSNAKKLIEDGGYPAWSGGGRYLAYLQYKHKVRVRDLQTGKTYDVCDIDPKDVDDFDWKLTFSTDQTFLFVPTKDGIHVYDFVNPTHQKIAMRATMAWTEATPTMSPSGKNLAFTRNGDVWISNRSEETGNPSVLDYGSCYFIDARRVAPLAVFNDTDGGSASTPYLVNDLVWLDEKHLWYHVQRYGGSGVSKIGLITLNNSKYGYPTQDSTTTKLLTDPDKTVFGPGLCPDGKTLTAIMHDGDDFSLFTVDSNVNPIRVICKGLVDRYAWRPVGKDPKPQIVPKDQW